MEGEEEMPMEEEGMDEDPMEGEEEDYSEAMMNAGLDAEDPASSEAFTAGVKYGKTLNQPVPQGTPGVANDSMDAITRELKAHYQKLNRAAYECRGILGYIQDPIGAFDSADDIYKKALQACGVDTKGVHPSAFPAMLKLARGNEGFLHGAKKVNAAYDSSLKNSARAKAISALESIEVQG